MELFRLLLVSVRLVLLQVCVTVSRSLSWTVSSRVDGGADTLVKFGVCDSFPSQFGRLFFSMLPFF